MPNQPLTYLDFDLAIETLDATANRYRIRVLNSPAGQATGEFTLPFDARDLELLFLRLGRPRRGVRRIGSPEMAAAKHFGSALYAAVFMGPVQNCLQRSLDIARRQEKGIRLRLRLSDAPALADLPWEFLFDSNQNHFLAYSTATPIVRYLDLPQGMGPLAVKPPLKILVMIANPRDYGYEPLDVEAEWQKVQRALADLEQQGLVEVTRLEAATLSALQRQLRRDQYHIFHFVGHGGFDEQTQSGVLLLEDEAGRSRTVSGHYLGALLRDHFSLRLALLNACEGARTSKADPFAGVAQQLVQQGIPAVIAMQFEITDGAAITLAYEFYGAVADGYPVDAALSEARKALYAAENDIEWGTLVLYLRAVDGLLFDVAALGDARKAAKAQRAAAVVEEEVPAAVVTPVVTPERADPQEQAVAADEVAEPHQSAGAHTNREVSQTFSAREPTGPVVRDEERVADVQATAQAETQPTATAMAAQAVTTMLQKIPAAQPLVDEYGMHFVEVPAGEFTMGSTEAEIDEAFEFCKQFNDSCSRDYFTNEAPPQTVNIDTFWIMQTEVTNAQYAAFVAADGYAEEQWWTAAGWAWRTENNILEPLYWNDRDWNQPDYPVVGISWYEAMAYAAWLTGKTELAIRLPTEAEWEKAARGTDGLVYPWGDAWDGSRTNYCDSNCEFDSWKDGSVNDGYATTAPVGSYPAGASPYGALDMAGNVWEWTSSQYGDYPYDLTDGREDPTGTTGRKWSGGSWFDRPNDMRAASRSGRDPDYWYHVVGVRLVLAVAPQ